MWPNLCILMMLLRQLDGAMKTRRVLLWTGVGGRTRLPRTHRNHLLWRVVMKEAHARWSFCLQRPLDHATEGPLRPLRANIHVVVLFTLFVFHVQMHGVPCFFLPSRDICISSWSFVWTARSLLNCCVVLLLSVTLLGASFIILCVCVFLPVTVHRR